MEYSWCKQIFKSYICEDCNFSAIFNLGLKRHKTLLHNFGVGRHSNVKIVHILQHKIMNRAHIVECWGANKETQEILTQPNLGIFHEVKINLHKFYLWGLWFFWNIQPLDNNGERTDSNMRIHTTCHIRKSNENWPSLKTL